MGKQKKLETLQPAHVFFSLSPFRWKDKDESLHNIELNHIVSRPDVMLVLRFDKVNTSVFRIYNVLRVHRDGDTI